ncbi:polysaccharide biosynthesis/export family protein [Mucilaginibacter sp. HMF5004]|uniref:polysaccharide biosynthesis/export family protein n=1 Tax=Mucilaginibacter rivuli TaxID=2857527 RepID=UPI001C604F34|nr:polysaccharide biosynthesis/export family protein [Mucilaginibacter rivuli]MBW4890076.1 polysaccharide biosynthesis/export family protein [Mucilaginibacter rivuli]
MLKTNKIVVNSIILCLCISVFSACSYKTKNVFFKTDKQVPLDSVKTVYVVQQGKKVNIGPHRIEPGDRLSIKNLSNPLLISGEPAAAGVGTEQNYQVGLDGQVIVPVIGRINLIGLTIVEASKKLQELYSTGAIGLANPVIEVKVVNMQVTVLGEVRNPGNFVLEHEETDLIQLLGQAGGTDTRADLRQIKIVRGDKLDPQILLVNLRNSNTLKDPRLTIQNHDIVYVEPAKLNGTGDQLQGFTSILQPLLLVLNALVLVIALRR